MSILYTFRSGKNNKALYFVKSYLQLLIPNFIYRRQLEKKLREIERRGDKAYIEDRVDYYNKMSEPTTLPEIAESLGQQKMGRWKVYYFDTRVITRWFDSCLKWMHIPGDVNYVPEYPSVVKSRPIDGDNRNGVLLKLNHIRHFIFVEDTKKFCEKKDLVIFRGKVKGKEQRVRFMEMYFGNKRCDLGDTSRNYDEHKEWKVEKMTIDKQLEYRYILAIEGVDVASNLKWIMSSNSIAVMPKPTCETWFMEGRLIAGKHYIEIKSDFSDLEEKLDYYTSHTDEAEEIIANAHEYVEQFKDKDREELIGLMVMDKYFRMTGQR